MANEIEQQKSLAVFIVQPLSTWVIWPFNWPSIFLTSQWRNFDGTHRRHQFCEEFRKKTGITSVITEVILEMVLFVCLFVFTRPSGTVYCWNYSHSHTVYWYRMLHVILISADTITSSSRFGPESTRGPIIATRHLASLAQGTHSPHDLPDLLSGRGLTYEGPCLKMLNVKMKKKGNLKKERNDTTLIIKAWYVF
jgi:hypothetical protein